MCFASVPGTDSTRAPELHQKDVKAARAAFGGDEWNVRNYYDEPETTTVDILECPGRPTEGFSTYSTVGLYLETNLMDDKDIRVELAGVAPSSAERFTNMLAHASFNLIKDGWLCAPGVVFPSLVAEYDLSSTLEHVVWMPPSPWEELGSVTLAPDRDVHWLLGIPISESERAFLHENGYDAVDDLFAEHGVPYYDIDREPLV